ncbi:MAG: hypothetical protein M3335_03685 [Actinomycetota bacterium]|nr:hypothetical protein [Actinomycetota bacterium]
MEGGRPTADTGAEARRDAEQALRGKEAWLLRGGLIGIAVLIALVTWAVTRGDDEGAPAVAGEGARIVSEGELIEAAARLGQPIYWAGPQEGTAVELEELGEEGVRVRYVPEGSKAGEAPADALAIGSYRLGDPGAALAKFAAEPGAVLRQGDGREVVFSQEQPTSVYFVDPENTVQVEVYDPAAGKALSLALSGTVEPAE